MFNGPIKQLPAQDYSDQMVKKQNEHMMMKFGHGGGPEIYMQGNIG